MSNLHSKTAPSPETGEARWTYKRFVLGFFCALALAVGGFATMLGGLEQAAMLPPPPLTANTCVDEKFKFLAERDLRDVDLIAVGSSMTWRNLDLSVFQKAGLSRKPLNAAPCLLQLGETTYFADFLLSHMDGVRTIVSVVTPRDFEQCGSAKEKFFSPRLAGAYVFGGLPSLPIYIAKFKPRDFVQNALHIKRTQNDPTLRSATAPGGLSGDMAVPSRPQSVLSETCFQALTELERIANAAGARLIVAAMPPQPEWSNTYDPDGLIARSFEGRLRAALKQPTTLFLPAAPADSPVIHHADTMRDLTNGLIGYTRQVVGLLAERPYAITPVRASAGSAGL